MHTAVPLEHLVKGHHHSLKARANLAKEVLHVACSAVSLPLLHNRSHLRPCHEARARFIQDLEKVISITQFGQHAAECLLAFIMLLAHSQQRLDLRRCSARVQHRHKGREGHTLGAECLPLRACRCLFLLCRLMASYMLPACSASAGARSRRCRMKSSYCTVPSSAMTIPSNTDMYVCMEELRTSFAVPPLTISCCGTPLLLRTYFRWMADSSASYAFSSSVFWYSIIVLALRLRAGRLTLPFCSDLSFLPALSLRFARRASRC
mmetsp:Transcript_31085/g.79811  ORF Transcript_31085/g.79811 Transcript_31085/m.79811 type:complete len:264 (-) Transcript_31085:299-1090(-)